MAENGMAYAFAILVIAFAVGNKKNFNISWTALAISVLFHIHEGLYGFVVVFILFLLDAVFTKKVEFTKNYCVLFFFISVMAIVILNMLTIDILTI